MGNPNPSPATRFGAPGGKANRSNGGKTSEQRRAEVEASERAAIVSNQMVSSIMEKLEAGQDAIDFIEPATLKLLKDVQDRAHGTPTQSVEHTSDGTFAPTVVERKVIDPKK